MINMEKYLQAARNSKNYEVSFFQGESIFVTAQDAAKVKSAILGDIRCFQVEDDLFATKSVSSIRRKKVYEPKINEEYDAMNPPPEILAAQKKLGDALKMDFYLDKKYLT